MRRSAFTLVELLAVMMIITILAGMVLAALSGAAESAKVQRAEAQIAKIDQLITEKWNSYRYRQVPIRIPAGTDPTTAARARLYGLRELMRMEMPERLTDVTDDVAPFHATYNPIPLTSVPTLHRAYQRRVTASAISVKQYEQAECLYLILQEMKDGDRSALNFFMSSEIGDIDGDGMNEILDPWGNPIMWLRWAPGYSKVANADLPTSEQLSSPWPIIDTAVVTMQVHSGHQAADPFDPLKADPRWNDSDNFSPFNLRPLIFSAGPDKQYDIFFGNTNFTFRNTTPPSDPYATHGQYWAGMPYDFDSDGLGHADNITNHWLNMTDE